MATPRGRRAPATVTGPQLAPDAAIKALEALKAEARDPSAIYREGEAAQSSWKSKVLGVVSRSLGPDSELAQKLRDNTYSLGFYVDGMPDSAFVEAFVEGIGRAVGYVDAAIFELNLMQEATIKEDAQASPRVAERVLPVPDPRAVFVIHGRNSAARDAMFAFLRALGLLPIEWSQAVVATGRPSPYVGEVLTAAFASAQAVLVLMTPDDEAQLRAPFRAAGDPPHESEMTPQARANVVFEAGMAMAWDEKRTVIVELGRCRPFSDIGGRHVLRLDDSSQRRQELAQRLGAAGLAVDMTGTDWHRAGEFEDSL